MRDPVSQQIITKHLREARFIKQLSVSDADSPRSAASLIRPLFQESWCHGQSLCVRKTTSPNKQAEGETWGLNLALAILLSHLLRDQGFRRAIFSSHTAPTHSLDSNSWSFCYLPGSQTSSQRTEPWKYTPQPASAVLKIRNTILIQSMAASSLVILGWLRVSSCL